MTIPHTASRKAVKQENLISIIGKMMPSGSYTMQPPSEVVICTPARTPHHGHHQDISAWLGGGTSSPTGIKQFREEFRAARRRSFKTVRQSQSTLAESPELLRVIEAVVAPLRKKIAKLEDAIKAPRAPELDDYDKWFASKDAEKYAGMHVAFESGKGVIASANNADELMQLIEKHKNPELISVSVIPG